MEHQDQLQDTFRGDTAHLIRCIRALLALDEAGVLEVGGIAPTLLAAAAVRLGNAQEREQENSKALIPMGLNAIRALKAMGWQYNHSAQAWANTFTNVKEAGERGETTLWAENVKLLDRKAELVAENDNLRRSLHLLERDRDGVLTRLNASIDRVCALDKEGAELRIKDANWKKYSDTLEKENAELRAMVKARDEVERRVYWRWMPEGDNKIESLACQVVIEAEDLRQLLNVTIAKAKGDVADDALGELATVLLLDEAVKRLRIRLPSDVEARQIEALAERLPKSTPGCPA